jgi:hypothetical protein
MNRWKTGLSFLALVAMTAEASAADLCDPGAAAAIKTAAVQQELMVAGFTCGAMAQYNRFVLAYQPELQKSDADLMSYFRHRDGRVAGYDSYKTKVANLAASRSAAEGGRYCQAMDRAFADAQGQTLKQFVASENLLIAMPEACGVKYDMPEMAGPSYQVPATPYGAGSRQAYNDPPPPRAQQSQPDQERDGRSSYYGNNGN